MKKQEKDKSEIEGDERPILTAGIGHRIGGLLEAHGAKRKMSDATGISLAQLDRYIKETGAPTIEPLARIAAAAGVCLEWLATGKGPKLLAEMEAQRFDLKTLHLAIQTVEEGLVATRRAMDSEKKAELIIAVYEAFALSSGKIEQAVVLRLIKSMS